MLNLIFLGPPGGGKGTQAEIVCSSMDVKKISTGELLRKMAKQKSDFGDEINRLMSSGALVSDEIVNKLIDNFYNENSSAKAVILDGYPRNTDQAVALDLILDK
jgi:adenylate kinase